MVKSCLYCGEEQTKHCGRSFHKFPFKNTTLLETWIKNLNLGQEFKPSKDAVLCSDHFDNNCFEINITNKQLIPDSVPTIFLQYKSACVFCHVSKKRGHNRTFRKFPLENPELLEKWLSNMNLENFIPNGKSLLCSDHFQENCFRRTGQNLKILTLRRNAIPTIFMSEVHVPCNQEKECTVQEHFLSSPSTSTEDTLTVGSTNKRTASKNYPLSSKKFKSSPDCEIVTTSKIRKFDDSNRKNVSDVNIDLSTVNCNTSEPPYSEALGRPTMSEELQLTPMRKRRLSIKHDHGYENSPKTARKKLLRHQAAIKILKKDSRVQKQHISRLKKRITSLKDVVSELRRTRAIPDSGLQCLDSIADTDVSQFLKRFFKNQKNNAKLAINKKRQWKCQRRNSGIGISREKYPPGLRCFAMTLHFYSPKAYGFVRRKFCKALPDPSTLRSWYSSIDGDPGFTSESFDALISKVEEAKKINKKVLVSLMLDEISIKKSLQRLPNGKVSGYVDFGTNIECDETNPIAKDALVLMVVSLDGSWKIPIAYFLVNGIDSETNTGLITDALIRLSNIGVEVTSVTLDGPAEHFATMRALGASFDLLNLKPFFPHPCEKRNVYVIFDPCHMLKLMRNCLGAKKILKDSSGNTIEWKFIENLERLQEEEGLRAGNKLKKRHIQYWKMKMKVSLAAQTLSSSVADSIEFCNSDLQLKQFKGIEATVRFIRCVDRIFDFLNSRNPFAKGFKSPLRINNEGYWLSPILSEVEYLKGITDVNGKSMLKTRRYVPFLGFITAVDSIIRLFHTYVKAPGSQLRYLLTYKFSQDHLELFFCAIRSCGGWCPSPTSLHFSSAYKRLLIRHEVEAVRGNAEAMDSTKVLTVSSTRKLKIDRYDPQVYDRMLNIRVAKKYGLVDHAEENTSDIDFFNEFKQSTLSHPHDITQFSKSCVAYIGGWVVRKLVNDKKPIIICMECRGALLQSSQTFAEVTDNNFIGAKTRGGLIFPSKSVTRICLRAEELLRNALSRINGLVPPERNFQALLCSQVMSDLLQPPCTLFTDLENHMFDESIDGVNHIYFLTREVCKTYIQVRLFAATKIASEKVIGMQIRNHLTRQIIWARQ